jgi:hypothetical protein
MRNERVPNRNSIRSGNGVPPLTFFTRTQKETRNRRLDEHTTYEVPREHGVTRYGYTVVNDRSVLVDPAAHRIVQVID